MTLSQIPTADLKAELRRRATAAGDPFTFHAATLVEAAAAAAGANPSEVSGAGKMRHLVQARWAVFATLRAERHSFSRIARAFRCDHGTVQYGCRRAPALAATSPIFRAALAACQALASAPITSNQ